MEYDVLRVDRRITQAYKKWHESRGNTTLSWRQSISEWMIKEAGLNTTGIPPAPPRLPAGRPKSTLNMYIPVVQKTAQDLANEDFDRRRREALNRLPKIRGQKPKWGTVWTSDTMMNNEVARAEWETRFRPAGMELDKFIEELNHVAMLEENGQLEAAGM